MEKAEKEARRHEIEAARRAKINPKGEVVDHTKTKKKKKKNADLSGLAARTGFDRSASSKGSQPSANGATHGVGTIEEGRNRGGKGIDTETAPKDVKSRAGAQSTKAQGRSKASSAAKKSKSRARLAP
eukprot:COSAG01_NODE_719_length_14073_cov_30.141906_9_plen_128_part_00